MLQAYNSASKHKPTILSNDENKIFVHLNTEEVQLLRKIQALCDVSGYQPRSDWELYAIIQVCEGSAKNAARRIENMRKAESEFNLNQITSEEAFDFVQRENPRFCGVITGKDEDDRDIIHSCVADHPSGYYTHKEKQAKLFKLYSDMFRSQAVSVEQFNKGCTWLVDCNGVSMFKSDLRQCKSMEWTYQSGYPVKIKKIVLMDASRIARFLYKCVSVFLTKKIKNRVRMCSMKEYLTVNTDKSQFVNVGKIKGDLSMKQVRHLHLERIKRHLAFEQRFIIKHIKHIVVSRKFE
eukprot:104869_1